MSHPEKKSAPTLDDIKGLDAPQGDELPLSVAAVLQGQIYTLGEAVKDLRLRLTKAEGRIEWLERRQAEQDKKVREGR